MTEGDRLVLHELVRRLSVPEDCKVVAGANLRAQGGLVAALVERGDAVSDRVYKRRRGQQRRLQIAP
ncbi:MAG: hypothetical protein JO288_01955 [Hyphomicrobiales bacterium]|nr:hypothetical protein [Hyphomicrobiales bacterium]